MDDKTKVLIIYVNYNTIPDLKKSICSFSEDVDFYDISYLVVDNNSIDQNFDCLNKCTKHSVEIVKLDFNVGFAAANNIGIKYAKDNDYDYYLLLNCDTLVTTNFVKKLLYVIMSDLNIGLVSSRIVYNFDKKSICYDGGKVNSYKGSVDLQNYLCDYNRLSTSTIETSFASGCCMLIPTKLDIKMSEDYFLYYEDTDFSNRILEKNLKIVIARDVILYHTESVSTKKKSNLYSYYFSRNRLIFIRDNVFGLKKYVAYTYSILWIIKKIICKTFNIKYSIIGVNDFLKNKRGKRAGLK